MSSAALPPLPSIRAKELEKKASVSAASNNIESVDNYRSSDSRLDAPVGKKNNEMLNPSPIGNNHKESSSSQTQINNERAEQLAMLHQREEKVFGNLPPLEPSVTCEAVHQYLSTTSQFLNSFIADASVSLEGTSHKLFVLEKQMALLESKLASIPGLFPDEDDKKECKENEEESEKDLNEKEGPRDGAAPSLSIAS